MMLPGVGINHMDHKTCWCLWQSSQQGTQGLQSTEVSIMKVLRYDCIVVRNKVIENPHVIRIASEWLELDSSQHIFVENW